jgi:hypothetical protein
VLSAETVAQRMRREPGTTAIGETALAVSPQTDLSTGVRMV